MSDEAGDDWFERALAERDSEDDPDADAGSVPESSGDADEAGTTAGARDAGAPHSGAGDTDAAADGDSLFDQDFGDALQNTGAQPDLEDAIDGETGGPDDATVFDELGDVDFELDAGAAPDFDSDEIDSSLPRIDLGIEGLDGMIQGGVPERSLMVAIGGAGTGKTTFGLQFLAHGLESGERAIFITLEETSQRVLDSATEKGFPFDEYVDEGQLAVVDVDPVEMANSLTSIRNELPRLIEEFGATRLVLDSVSLLEMMYDDRANRRNEIFDFAQSLKSAGVTSLLTSEAAEETSYASRYGIVEYLTDAVFVMQYVRPDDFRETRLAVEIQKIRDANHSREKKPYEITHEGISVHQQANLF